MQLGDITVLLKLDRIICKCVPGSITFTQHNCLLMSCPFFLQINLPISVKKGSVFRGWSLPGSTMVFIRAPVGVQDWPCALALISLATAEPRSICPRCQSVVFSPETTGFTCMRWKITQAGMPNPSCLLEVLFMAQRKICPHRGGQSVPLCLHYEAVALTAVGSRCSVVSGKGLQGPQHSALQGLHT